MVDRTGVTIPTDPVKDWLLILFVLAVFNVAWIALFGFQSAQINILVSGLVLVPLAYVADRFSNGQIFRSPASFGAISFSAMLPIYLVEFTGFASSLKFSFYRASSKTYFSTVLQSAPPTLQDAFNFFYAPVIETFAGLSVTIVSYRIWKAAFLQIGVPTPIAEILAALLAPFPAAWMLSNIHTTAGIGFQIVAFIVFYLMIIPIFLEDVTGFTLIPVIPVTMGTFFGFHWTINGSQLGGFFSLMGRFWANSSEIAWSYKLIVLFFAATIIGSAWYAWKKTAGRFVSIRSLLSV